MKPPCVGSGCRVTRVATGGRPTGRASSPTRRSPSAVCSSKGRRSAGSTVAARICSPWKTCASVTGRFALSAEWSVVSSGVVAEAATRLSTEAAGGHQLVEQWRGGEARLWELEVEGALDRQRDVETHDVEQVEGAQWIAATDDHRGVDVLDRGVVGLEHLDRVVEVGEQQRVDDEAGSVAALHRVLAGSL